MSADMALLPLCAYCVVLWADPLLHNVPADLKLQKAYIVLSFIT
jgi:hypothetical protein